MDVVENKSDNDDTQDEELSWIRYPRQALITTYGSYYSVFSNTVDVLLTKQFETIDYVPGLKTSLFPHQKTVVKAMLDLEINREFTVGDYTIKTTAGILSEAVGSGKTLDMLSVILTQKLPKVVMDISTIDMFDTSRIHNITNGLYVNAVRKKFLNILTPTIVFTGVSVVDQWVQAVKSFTSLKYFVVLNVKDLQLLINKMSDKSINQYDIIIVKNGKVTRPIQFPKYITTEFKNVNRSVLHIYNVIGNMRNFCWARVVVDDFDTIQLPSDASIINGLFTWYISSTRKLMNTKIITNSQFTTTSDMLMYNNNSWGDIMNNHILFYHLNIRNDEQFVQSTNKISSPKFYAYVFENLNDKYMGFLGLMGNAEAIEVMEMLNGDAIGTAAERIGIQTNSVADIFQSMLGKQFKLYEKSVDVLGFIASVEPMQGLRTPMSENPDEQDTYNKSDLFQHRSIEYNYPNLKGLLDSTKEEYIQHKQTSSISIERVKSNIKEGECPICVADLNDDEEGMVILKCCGVILCGMCCFGTVFPKNSATGQCSNCRASLTFQNLIYLNSNFDLDKITEENLSEDVEEIKTEEVVVKEKPRTKMTAILEIINGVKPQESKRVDVNISNLMKGTSKLETASYNKVLIFANFDETIQNIKTLLDENNIHYWKLGGTHKEITNTVEQFTSCQNTCVMIINSMKHCSGLNLQTATDLIFAHKIIDKNVETQVIGRGQRLGRINQLRVHFMFYENEYNWMSQCNEIREIPDDN